MNNTSGICPVCGAALPVDAPRGLCPRCLLTPPPKAARNKSEISNSRLRYFGDYELLEEIARGGMGVVYRATQVSLHRTVAVKMILAGQFASAAEVARFRAEAEAAANLQHPNIVAIHEVGEHDGRQYFSMDYVEGRNLAELVREGPLSARRAAEIMQAVAGAIHYAHGRGVLHRDLKPGNILIDEFDEPRVTDFGLAKRISSESGIRNPKSEISLTLTGQVLGTPHFMPPEQARGRAAELGPHSDVYSLGAILFFLLTGRAPFLGETLEQTLHHVLTREPVSPRLLDPGVPRDLETICLKCLEKDPRRRYATAQELADELGRFLRDEPIRARPIAPVEKLWRWCRRQPVIAGLAAGVVLLLFALAVGSSVAAFRIDQARRQATQNALDESRQRQRAEEALTRLEFQRAQEMFTTDNAASGLGHLAHLLRQNPMDRLAAQRLISALSQRNFSLPLTPPLRHQGRVMSVRFSPDGGRVLTASEDHTARIWDALSGEPLAPSLEHGDKVGCAEFSPDGRWVATASADQTARVWDAATGRAVTPPLAHAKLVQSVCFSPDSRLVATASWDWTARLWDAQTGQPIGPPLAHRRPVHWVRFSPDGRRVATASDDRTAQVWDARIGQPLLEPMKHPTEVEKVEFSPDGKLLLTMSRDSIARFWDSHTGRAMGASLEDVSQLRHVAFSPDGERVLTTTFHGHARVWDVRTRHPVGETMRHRIMVGEGSFSPEGLRVFTVSGDNTARIWNAETGEPLTEPLPHAGEVLSGGFSPDGLRVVTGSSDHKAQIWDVAPGAQSAVHLRHQGWVRFAEFSPDHQLLATAAEEGVARVWNLRTGQPVTPPLRHTDGVLSVHFSPDGTRLVSASDDRTARLWDAHTGDALVPPLQHDGAVASAAFSPDGERIVTASEDRTARVWNARTGALLPPPLSHHGAVHDAQFSPDGKMVVTASTDGAARLWAADTGQPLLPPLRHQARVDHASFSPDGRRVLTASRDGTARLWDARTGQPLTPPLPQGDLMYHARFSSDGQWFVTAGGDHTARVFATSNGLPVSPLLKHHGYVGDAEFSPDGWRVATASPDTTAGLWDWRTGQLIAEPLRSDHAVRQCRFSGDGRWIVQTTYREARVFELPAVPVPAPAWLPELAEAVAGQRFDAAGNPEPVSSVELCRLRRQFADSPKADFYSHWAAWFLADRGTRTISPSSLVAMPDQIQERIGQSTMESLQEALRLSPTNAEVMARLALKVRRNVPADAPPPGARAEWLSRRAVELAPTNDLVQRIRGEVHPASRYPARDPDAGANLIDLTMHYNQTLDHSVRIPWLGTNASFARLPTGRQNFSNVVFDVRGIVQLAGQSNETGKANYPDHSTNIVIGQTGRRLHFLHSAMNGYRMDHGEVIARYVLHYADGQTAGLSVNYGEDVQHWWPLPYQPAEPTQAVIAWQDERADLPVRLFKRTWMNPRPDVEIRRLDFISAKTKAVPLLIAITVE